ncbi:type II and III secretion system protein family protein [Sphingomonas oligophenolica]|uniref:Type II and III secretion system protein family protein n=1 Tax=Sphingomonas oligophenolica TaxID=301154 RepID=A0A502CP76_9SPHN|nr:type II and III secretion system protein family protein [Sphingomonas oligophenolica]TPG13511.1 type II and III secretion system protein family protein [Sphingomonas oligophenolica]
MRISMTQIGLPLAVALASAATIPSPLGAQARIASAPALVEVNTGRGRLVTLATPMTDVFVADDAIADVQVRSPTQIYIFGKKPGETTISATSRSGAVVYSSTVRVGNNFDSIGSMLGLAMPDAQIVATPMNGLVLLTGTVAQPEDAAEAERLVQAYVGDATKVLSRLKSATPLQVNLQVRIAEVSRNFAKNIGSNLSTIDGTGGFKFGVATGRAPGTTFTTDPNLPLGVGSGTVSGYTINPIDGKIIAAPGSSIQKGPLTTTFGGIGKLLGLNLLGALDLGETLGQVSTLANPNLTALSGETASFLAGGEIPIPISQGLGAVSVEYKQYGISLSYTPTVLSDGRISLRVRPEVSQLSAAGAVQINGTTIPALTTRRAETTLELGSGQSMMIGGLLQNSTQNSIEKTPGLGDVPVLGALFRSNGWQRNETELVIVVTPYLVKPVNNAADIALPTDGYRAPTDLGRVFLGELGSGQSGAQRPVPTMAGTAPVTPTIGAAAAVPTMPSPQPVPARRAETKAINTKKGAIPAPGFSN